jgi:glucosamine-6-phosphate deaminase
MEVHTGMKTFDFEPSRWVPFRDKKVCARVRKIKRADMAKHSNKDLSIRVVPDGEVGYIWATDVVYRIKTAAERGEPCVLIMPNPARLYRVVAHMLNTLRIDCKHVTCFIMDEYADQDGNIAPPEWPLSFMYSFRTFFWESLDPKLRPPAKQIIGPTNRNLKDYGRMITDRGGGTACYTGPGWTGHMAFIEPDAPEFDAPLKQWMKMGPRIVTLSPFTIAQNSMHGFFGRSGDLAAVPPRAFTIGPAQVIESKYRMEIHALTTAGTAVSWQRFMTRLILHGPVTPRVPTSVHQLLKTDFIISETAAQDIEPHWDFEY